MSDSDNIQMSIRYLLFQMRRMEDAMRTHEVMAFAQALSCSSEQITSLDLTRISPSTSTLATHDMVLIGGAGDYSVSEGGPWLHRALDTMRTLDALSKPTFASCWGFQALAAALGGLVVTDSARAELGTLELQLTQAGHSDPIFRHLGHSFYAQVGHHDTVDVLPAHAIQLARSPIVENHAFCIRGKPIYATQFHPELRRQGMMDRLSNYPHYADEFPGLTIEAYASTLRETPRANDLLKSFVAHVFAD